jgi:cyclic pyranopterin phosphate synthase
MDVAGRPSDASGTRPAHLGHRPLQLPLRLLHAEGGLRPRLRVPAASELLSFEEIERLARLFVALGVREAPASPAASRSCAADLEQAVALLARSRTARPDADDQRLAARPKAQALADGRAAPRHGQPRLARRRDVPRDERRRLPGRRVLEGIDAAQAAGLAPVKVNMVVKRGTERAASCRWPSTSAAPRHILRFIEYMDVGAHQRLALDDVVPPPRSSRDRRAIGRSSRSPPELPGEVADRWRYRDGAARSA